MQKILVSACLLGEAVRYDGKDQLLDHKLLKDWIKNDRVLSFCPEVSGGMPIPRIAAEILGGDGNDVISGSAKVIDKLGKDVTENFIQGAQNALSTCLKFDIKIAILSQRSPSCGNHRIYDGSFSRSTRPGSGVTAALLLQHGIRVFNQTELEAAEKFLQESTNITFTPMSRGDFEQFWPTFKNIIEAQETYAFDPDMNFEQAYDLWCNKTLLSHVAKIDGKVTGSYYIKANAAGPGSHICNCGYMVSPQFRGQGIARKLCQHSQKIAVEQGFSAMQFNSVVSTNKSAIHIWKSMGFSIIGTIPAAYQHKKLGLVDAFIMYKALC